MLKAQTDGTWAVVGGKGKQTPLETLPEVAPVMDEVALACRRVVDNLGFCQRERTYQLAIAAELRCRNFVCEVERELPIRYVDSVGSRHLIGSDRIDIVCWRPETRTKKTVLEIKHAAAASDSHHRQCYRYVELLRAEDHGDISGLLLIIPRVPTANPVVLSCETPW